jgi:hypothetical protein
VQNNRDRYNSLRLVVNVVRASFLGLIRGGHAHSKSMAAPFGPRVSHAKPPVPVYNSIACQQSAYPGFPTAVRHDDSGYDAAGYEHRHPDAQHHIDHNGMDPHTSPIQQLDLATTDSPTKAHSASTYYSTETALQAHNTPAPGQFDMLPPLLSTHASWQALHDYAQSHASEHGYALSINTTAKNRSRIKLACVCYGQPKNTHKLTAETRIRKNRVSYKTGCKMWVEGKKQEDGTWLLRVGEPQHNHVGRPSEGWAVQRKRTWGVVGGRIGVGGVTAKEELAKLSSEKAENDENEHVQGEEAQGASQKLSHSLERGGLVWKIVEQEMLYKGQPSQSRDRGVGRTVQVLQARLPGIRIFKRDVYNIRAQIKKARKAAGQQIGDGINSHDEEGSEVDAQEDAATEDDEDHIEETCTATTNLPQTNDQREPSPVAVHIRDAAVDPSLMHQGEDIKVVSMPSHHVLSASSAELEQLRKEVSQLKSMLGEKTKEVKEKNIEIAGLRTQLEYMTSMAMLPS